MKRTLTIEPGSANNWGFVGSVALVVHSSVSALETERWNQWIRELAENKPTHVLGGAWGAASVDSVQRGQAAALLKGTPTAIVVNHPVARGIVTAIGWLGLNVKGFGWEAVPEAVAWLNPSNVPHKLLIDTFLELQTKSIENLKGR